MILSKSNFSFFVLISSIMFLNSCTTGKLSNTNVAFKYRQSNTQLNPSYSIYHHTNDSSTIHLKLPLIDVLYKKDDDNSFASKLLLQIKIYPDFTSKEIADSISFIFSPNYTSDSTILLYKNFEIKSTVQKSVMHILLRDLNRSTVTEDFTAMDKSPQSAQTFLVKDSKSGLPLFSSHIIPGDAVAIETAGTSRSIYLRYFNKSFPLALPPFVMREENKFSYRADVTQPLDEERLKLFSVTKKGIYHFQYDTLLNKGLTLFYFDDDFPLVTDATQLIEGLRYLTSNNEYEKLKNAADKKEAIDNFWIAASGSRERGKRLIQTYYSRMQDANSFFSSYLEGWKTDRGMVYLIFGKPQTVYQSDEKEYWEYAYMPNYGSLSFTFKKIYNPFTENDFELERQMYYESLWYMAVDKWRQGRIYFDE